MKHAFLILAHNEFGLLQTLISCLDDPRNDIYVHIDRKVTQVPRFHAGQAGLEMLENRVDIRWGDLSMVEAEYALFEAAASHGPYSYYHLLSGVDLPLKSQDYIHRFFDEHAEKEFIGYTLTGMTPELSTRMQRWHLFPRHFSRKRNGYSLVRAAFIRLQKVLGIRRNTDIDFKKGSQWVSITQRMTDYILAHKDWSMRTFTHTFVPDECLVQTLAWMSPCRDQLYSLASDETGCMRAIGWRNDQLIDWCADDFNTLAASPALFARKFNSKDPSFIERVREMSRP
jgi:hypothetical protein